MFSAIYEGTVRHRRYQPKHHSFSYRVYMVYLDIDELDEVLKKSSLWSMSRWSPVRFKRADFHGDSSVGIREAVSKTVAAQLDYKVDGPLRVLNNWRYFGFSMNPLSTYYCFDKTGKNLDIIVAEVNNTPWNERRAYVLDVRGMDKHDIHFDKDFSVSPFHPVDMLYRWRSTEPKQSLVINIDNFLDDKKVFDATLRLQRQELTPSSMRSIVIRYPMMTVKVVSAIYWQALRLWLKGVPFLGKNKLSSQEQTS